MTSRTRSLRLFVLVPLLAVFVATDVAPLAAQVIKRNADDEELNNVFLPAPRELRQKLAEAEQAIQEDRYEDAVSQIGEVLMDPEAEDYFIGRGGEEGTRTSIKAKAQELIRGLPPKGQREYELQFGIRARKMLSEAVNGGDVNRLNDVTRMFFHTEAGYEATMLLGRHHLDRGRPLAAALCFDRVVQTPAARDKYEPEPSLMLAICWLHAHAPDKATEVLLSLRSRMRPKQTVQVGGKDIEIFDETPDALPWLKSIVGTIQGERTVDANQWSMFRGDPTRNARSGGGMPLAHFRWKVPTLNDPNDERLVEEINGNYGNQKLPALPTVQPLAVRDVVLMRTAGSVLGVDFKTGKRVWEFPWDRLAQDEFSDGASQIPQANGDALRSLNLNQRLWDDSAFGQMTSDGDTVYLLDRLGYGNASASTNRIVVGLGGQIQANPNAPRTNNQLVALNLSREGSMRWIVGDASGEDEPRLAGAFFLGPPLEIVGQLYVLAELNSEIRLVVLDAKTGRLQWWQQLAHVETSPINNDSPRRLAGATPSFADGVLVCPTSAGALVAVDLATRSLLWGYQYPQQRGTPRHIGFGQMITREDRPVGSRWADGTATIAKGRVILTPVESEKIHCLDLLTGQPVWENQPDRADRLYVACVHEDSVVFVGKDGVDALGLADGQVKWKVNFENAMPSGRGYYSEQFYYLPTTDSHLVRIDLDKGAIDKKVKTETVLGNLICYKGNVISQGTDVLTAFHQEDPLRDRVNQRLKENPDDIEALAWRGELLLQDGQRDAALEVLRRAHKLDPADPFVRGLLVDTLLAAVRDDFQIHADVVSELERLIDEPDQRGEYLRLKAWGLQKAGKTVEAFSAYVDLSGFGKGRESSSAEVFASEPERIDAALSARRDRWLQARIAEVIAAAPPAERVRVDAEIVRLRQDVPHKSERIQLRRFVSLFGGHPLGQQARVDLAAQLARDGQAIEAELLLESAAYSNDPTVAAAATARLAQLLAANGQVAASVQQYRRLAEKWGDTVCLDDKTGKQLIEQLEASSPVAEQLQTRVTWKTGHTEVVEGADRVSTNRSLLRNYPLDLRQADGPLGSGIRVLLDTQRGGAVVVRNGNGEQLASVSLLPTDGSSRIYSPNPSISHCRIRGHLLLVSVGYELIAVDLLRAETKPTEAILWRQDMSGSTAAPLNRIDPRLQVKTELVENPWGHRQYVSHTNGLLLGATGPITADGFCYINQRELICASPLTGERIWSRTDLEPGCDLLGDEEFVIAVMPNETEAMIFNMVDGSLVGRRNLAGHENRWTTLGRRMLTWSQRNNQLELNLYDPVAEIAVWSRRFPLGSKGWLIEHDEVAVLEPEGRLIVLSLRDERVRLEAQIDAENTLESIFVFRSESQYILFANGTVTATPNVSIQGVPSGYHSPLVSGRVYAFDRQSGEMTWQVAAVVSAYGLPLDQPPELPVLLFLRQITGTVPGQPTLPRTSVLCVDKRDGRIVLSDDEIRARTNGYEIVGNPSEQKVYLEMTGKKYTLTFTDEPTPPEPPAQTGAASSLTALAASAEPNTTGSQRGNLFDLTPADDIRLDPEILKKLQEDLERNIKR